ncbi:MAG: hypothetical protein NVSMB17_08720 [Candidatus Dormibacteria bacterium]
MTATDNPTYRVLIVDDLPEIRMMVRTRLRMMPDVEVVGEASNGREAIRLVAALAPEAVILDLEMPVMRGDEAIPRMRELAPGIRVLLYTGAEQSTIDEISEAAKPDVVVSKGGALIEVVEQLRALLDMGPYDVLRLVLGTIPLDQAVTVFDTWVGLNVRIFESLARGDELERAQLGGATVEELEALIGVYAHLGDNLQKAAREGEAEVVPIIHLLRTSAAAARRALVAFDDDHLEDFYRAWDYRVPAHAATALREMRDRLLDALPTSGAEDAEDAAGVAEDDPADPRAESAKADPTVLSPLAGQKMDDIVREWVTALNTGSAEALAAFYAPGAEAHGESLRKLVGGRPAASRSHMPTPSGYVVELDLASQSGSVGACCVLELTDGRISRERDYLTP